MDCLKIEIEKFNTISKYSPSTKSTYFKHLTLFLTDLCTLTESDIFELHLKKIYQHEDIRGNIAYKWLDNELLDEYLCSKVAHGYSWLRSFINALSSFFKYLNKNYDFPNLMKSTTFSIKEFEPQKEKRKILNRHNIIKFLQSLIKNSEMLERDSLLFLLLLSTGSRISEILTIHIKDIDVENELIYKKQTKNKNSKYIVLRKGFGDILKNYIESKQLLPNDFLFSRDKKKLARQEVQDLLTSYLDKAKLPSITLHSLRHTFATLMVESGANILIIQQLLGHKTINSTKTYVHSHYLRNQGLVIKENKSVYKHIRR